MLFSQHLKIIISNKIIKTQHPYNADAAFLTCYSIFYGVKQCIKTWRECATFGTCLALICTKNRLKSLEVTINEASKIRDLQPFSHFTKDY